MLIVVDLTEEEVITGTLCNSSICGNCPLDYLVDCDKHKRSFEEKISNAYDQTKTAISDTEDDTRC